MKTITYNKTKNDPFVEILLPLAKEKAEAAQDFKDFQKMSLQHNIIISDNGELVI